ncbi:MAG: hypothetical protein JRH17_11165 [Deltaproteobacteria bacterium]|nr:hypothetical protein [Deltaproteobacteria bacterium]MBW2695811.1 hypothetical protein [Deltaproteobacteria bacterium]
MSFALTRLRASDRGFVSMLEAISADENAVLLPAKRWGAFSGLFGLASNELFLITVGDVENLNDRLFALDMVVEAETLWLEATIRPTSPLPLGRKGLYVFRFFEVANKDVEEIAALSKEAWETFEDTNDYSAEPQALFCQADRSSDRGRMLLLTWYDGFDSWQTSRKPHPKAQDLFVRRHNLTQGTIAYATRLLSG